jgi:hypothetical protein
MTANHYNMTSFGEGLNFSDAWLDLPPQFMGTATSFGQQSHASLTSPITHSLPSNDYHDLLSMPTSTMMPPPPPPVSLPIVEEHTSAELLAAATLLTNGHAASRLPSSPHEAGIFGGRSLAQHSMGLSVGHQRYQTLVEYKPEEHNQHHHLHHHQPQQQHQPQQTQTSPQIQHQHLQTDSERESTFPDLFFPPTDRSAPRPKLPLGDFQWGSDSSFSQPQGFVPQSEKDTSEAMEKERLKYMECLEVNPSAANTRQSSPVNADHGPLRIHRRKTSDLTKPHEDPDNYPRKRRKSRNTSDDAEEEDDGTPSAKGVRKRKSKTDASQDASSIPSVPPLQNGAGGKRRKSGVNGAKPPRENLSEEQKRENHIRSEQKRRTLIKEGFDDLCELVPGLRGGGFSKSTMLGMAAEWLDDLLKVNDQLRSQLAALEGQ